MSDKTPVPTTTMELRLHQLTTDLHALQAELERLLVEKRFQAKQIASLTGERNHLAQQYAALRAGSEQNIGMLQARLEEGAAERAILQSNYESSQAEHERERQTLAAEKFALGVRLDASEARLQASTTGSHVLEERVYKLAADNAALEENVRALTAEKRELGTKLDASLSRLNGILGSRTWKALSPYRKGGEMLSLLRPRLLRDLRLIRKSGLFDEPWYLSQYPDVQIAGVDPLMHYLRSGAAEGRDPNPYFDSDWYLRNNPDVAAAGINPLRHYLRNGAAEHRDPSSAFNTKDYLRKHPEVRAARLNPLVHFLSSRKSR